MLLNFHKYKVLIIGGAVTVLLLGAGSFMLFKSRSEYLHARVALASEQAKLDRLNRRDPFPSQENISQVDKNSERIEGYLDAFFKEASAGRIEPRAIERSAFPTLLENAFDRLRVMAESNDVEVAERFTYGFEKYAAGELPADEHVARLTIQGQSIQVLCKMLFEAGIASLESVEREVFDVASTRLPAADPSVRRRVSRATPRGRPPTAEPPRASSDPEYLSRERIKVKFRAIDEVIWRVLNALGAHPTFFILVNFSLMNEAGQRPTLIRAGKRGTEGRRTAVAPVRTGGDAIMALWEGGGAGAGEKTAPKRVLSHEDRLVAGQENVGVELTVDVYRFLQESAEGEP